MKTRLVLLVALAGLAAPQGARALEQHVHIQGISFEPATIELVPGDSVTWDNHATILHTVTHRECITSGPACAFDSEVPPGDALTHAFPDPGVFRYQCRIHGFSATITVADPSGAFPDLQLEQLLATPTTALGAPTPATTRVELTARNVGPAPSAAAAVVFEYRYRGRWHPIGSGSLPPLGPGESARHNALWDTAHLVGDFIVRARIDPDGLLQEERETNNADEVIASLWVPPSTIPGLDLLDPLG